MQARNQQQQQHFHSQDKFASSYSIIYIRNHLNNLENLEVVEQINKNDNLPCLHRLPGQDHKQN